jgi:hypothetical protein
MEWGVSYVRCEMPKFSSTTRCELPQFISIVRCEMPQLLEVWAASGAAPVRCELPLRP